ncbi:MAG: M14 family zinc carboxypeptidase [Gemmatimonadota bacterium]
MTMPRKLKTLSLFALMAIPVMANCTPGEFPTPLELAEGDAVTSYEEMMSFLGHLQAETGSFTLDTIGTSVEGRKLVMLRFADQTGAGSGPGEKLKVLMFAQQHGNEPSGKEAAIALARDIATGAFTGFLGSVDIYLIPQINPDGSEKKQRGNAGDMDLNRDHLTLSTPEVAALHSVYNELLPEVTLDVHEYGFAGSAWVEAGLHKNFGQQIGALSNENMSMALRRYAWDQVIPDMKNELAPKDVILNRYLVTDGPEARFRYSTTALNDGRNSMGIYHSLSFLIEGRNGRTMEADIHERARQQLETMKSFIGFFGENAAEVKALVDRERGALTGAGMAPDVALVMDFVPDAERPNLTVGVIDIETGEEVTKVIEAFHPLVEATLWVQRPLGYVIPANLTDIIAVLERHGIEAARTESPTPATLESYRIERVTPSQKEDKDFVEVEVTVTEEEALVPAGDLIVRCDQMGSNLIVTLLEPQSQWGLAPLPEFATLLTPGSDYPIKRIVRVPG